MTQVTKMPLCDFRALSYPSVGVQATATTTAPTAATQPPSSNITPYLVIEDITACLYCGTAAHTAVRVNLIDGTTGGTNVQWSALLAGIANGYANIAQNSMNIKCMSGYATLEFAVAPSTSAQQSIAFGGYYAGGYNQ